MSKIFERYVERDQRFEVVGPTRVGLCCFRLRGTNDINNHYLENINASRRLHMVPSYFHELFVIRYAPCYEFLNEAHIELSWRICDEFATAIIHQYMKSGVDSNLLAPLFELQKYYDDLHKTHPDSVWDKEEKEAEAFVASHQKEDIVDMFMGKLAGYGDIGDDANAKYDGYLRAHPEMLKIDEIKGEPKLTAPVPSMMRLEIHDQIMSQRH